MLSSCKQWHVDKFRMSLCLHHLVRLSSYLGKSTTISTRCRDCLTTLKDSHIKVNHDRSRQKSFSALCLRHSSGCYSPRTKVTRTVFSRLVVSKLFYLLQELIKNGPESSKWLPRCALYQIPGSRPSHPVPQIVLTINSASSGDTFALIAT